MNKEKMVIVCMGIVAMLSGGCAGTGNAVSTENEISTDEDNNVVTAEELECFSTPEEIAELGLPEDMLAFYLALNSKKPFVSADEGCQEFYWDEYFWHQGELELSYKITGFMLVDMDGDEEKELILTGYMPETTQVLDYQEGMVYSYQFAYRGMKRILTSGVYDGSSGYDINGFYRIYFDKGTYEEERLAYMEHDYYEVEGVEVSSEEFYAYTEDFVNAERVEDIDFTEEMLEEKLLGDLSEEELSVVKNIAPEEIIEEDIPYTAEEIQDYLDVLTEGKAFICVTDNRQKFFLEDNYVRNKTGEDEYQVLYFSIVDMDRDEKPEMILTCYPDTVLILHDTEEGVRGYRFSIYDEIRSIGKDGIYQFDKYGTRGYGRIVSFETDGCVIEPVDNHDSINDDRIRYYFFSEETINQWLK